eukprot:3313728-Pyramimonas_sp.AAC.1
MRPRRHSRQSPAPQRQPSQPGPRLGSPLQWEPTTKSLPRASRLASIQTTPEHLPPTGPGPHCRSGCWQLVRHELPRFWPRWPSGPPAAPHHQIRLPLSCTVRYTAGGGIERAKGCLSAQHIGK